MSNDIPGLVETSTNLAAVKSAGADVQVLMSSRSSVASALEWIRDKIEAVYTDGVLKLTLPKAETAKVQKISVSPA